MELLYIANARIPTEKAHGLHIVEMCHALANSGVDVTLVLPLRKNAIEQDISSYYGIEKNFAVEYVPIIDWNGKGFFGYWISQIIFSFKLLKKVSKKSEQIILTRDQWSGWLLAYMGRKVFYDMHGFPVKWRFLWKMAMKKMQGIICTNEWKMRKCNVLFGIKEDKMVLARNGFEPEIFQTKIEKKGAREKTNLPLNKNIVLYSGHLYDWKGVNVLAEVAKQIPEAVFVFIGGSKKEVDDFLRNFHLGSNILVLGQQIHSLVPYYLRAADVLVLPNSQHSKNPRFSGYSTFDTSPLKMFEYMASGRPIVASRLPAICEVLNESNSLLVSPDDSVNLANGIKQVLCDDNLAKKISDQAIQDSLEFTWQSRAQKIINFINKTTYAG